PPPDDQTPRPSSLRTLRLCVKPSFSSPSSQNPRIQHHQVVPNHRYTQNQRINPIQNPSMPRQQPPRILHPSRPLVPRFQQIPHLSRHIPDRSHRQQMPHGNLDPVAERPRHQQRPHHPTHRPFPSLLRRKLRRHQMFPNSSPHKISHRIPRPGNPARKQQKLRSHGSQSMKRHCVRKRKRHQQQRARTNPRSRQRLDQYALPPNRNHRQPQHK